MPASGTWIAAMPAQCGSISRSRSGPIRSQRTPLAVPLASIFSICGSSLFVDRDDHLAAHDRTAIPRARQNSSIATLPVRQF